MEIEIEIEEGRNGVKDDSATRRIRVRGQYIIDGESTIARKPKILHERHTHTGTHIHTHIHTHTQTHAHGSERALTFANASLLGAKTVRGPFPASRPVI